MVAAAAAPPEKATMMILLSMMMGIQLNTLIDFHVPTGGAAERHPEPDQSGVRQGLREDKNKSYSPILLP